MPINLKCLVLNNQYLPLSLFPLSTISVEDAFVRYFKGNCQVVLWHDRRILTPSHKDLYWPSIIVNNKSAGVKSGEVRLRKTTLFYRDNCKCAHCLTDLTFNNMTYEHVLPKAKGGVHSWENVVAACKECNSRKGDNLPVGRFKPKIKPFKPTYFDLLESRKKFPIHVSDLRWKSFLPGFTEVVLKN